MSELTDTERFVLSRAGFTEREINTMQRKFYNLFNVNPLLATEVKEYREWMLGEIPEQIRQEEREECAEVAESGTGEAVQLNTLKILRKERERIAAAILARK